MIHWNQLQNSRVLSLVQIIHVIVIDLDCRVLSLSLSQRVCLLLSICFLLCMCARDLWKPTQYSVHLFRFDGHSFDNVRCCITHNIRQTNHGNKKRNAVIYFCAVCQSEKRLRISYAMFYFLGLFSRPELGYVTEYIVWGATKAERKKKKEKEVNR